MIILLNLIDFQSTLINLNAKDDILLIKSYLIEFYWWVIQFNWLKSLDEF